MTFRYFALDDSFASLTPITCNVTCAPRKQAMSIRVIGPPRSSSPGELAAPAVTVPKEALPDACRLVDVIKRIDLSPERRAHKLSW
jgi:hypothetical protein